jgi:hypothetical protein
MAFEKEHLSVYSFCEGKLEGCSFNGDHEGHVEKALVTGVSSHRGPVGDSERGLMYRVLRETEEGYVDKALQTGIPLQWGPAGKPGTGLVYQGLWEMDEGGSRS